MRKKNGIEVPETREEAAEVLGYLIHSVKDIAVHMDKCRRANNRKDAEAVIVATGALLQLHMYFEEEAR